MASNSFVYILESPSPADLVDGRTEGKALCSMLELAGHPHSYAMTVDREQFTKALSITDTDSRFAKIWRGMSRPPVIHLSMHGNADGVGLTSGEFVTWDDLRQILMPINKQLSDGLLVCLSTCSGYSATRMSMYLDNEPPFWAITGSPDDLNWTDGLVGFTAFYHHWFKGAALNLAVEAMNAAAGRTFFWQSGKETKSGYQKHLFESMAASLPGPPRSNVTSAPPLPAALPIV